MIHRLAAASTIALAIAVAGATGCTDGRPDAPLERSGASEARVLPGAWADAPPLPMAVANNAVASLQLPDGLHLYTFLGIDTTRTYAGITRRAFSFDVTAEEWKEIAPVPGPVGRLAATAIGFRDRVYLFGGYTVDAAGAEVSVPDLDIYVPRADRYEKGAPFQLPVDDAVSGLWRDSLIFIVSGWSQRDNVPDVQIYDPAADRWASATPISGPPVFGHAGAIVGDAIVYCDGVRVDAERSPRFVMSEACYRGDIDPAEPSRISWRELARHPGAARYRMAAGKLDTDSLIVFAGGTDNPYNYNGIGYDGNPSQPSPDAFAYDVRRDVWIELSSNTAATMDHRGLVGTGDILFLIGGMTAGQAVTKGVGRFQLRP